MTFSESYTQSIAPNAAAFLAGKKLASKEQWQSFAQNERAIWGAIKGSGSNPYLVQIDTQVLAYKCTCPSRQFPCKHSIALMLLHAQHAALFTKQDEPEWVKTWLDKRLTKEKSKTEETERSDEDLQKLEKNREKTQQNRLASVQAGAEELERWLKDLVRMGLLELPNKNLTDFERVAARMVDAKAPGLAGWVRQFTKLNFENQQSWQQEALFIISRLFLLVSAIRKYDSLSPEWQQTIKNLAGWSQSSKELIADANAETIKDQWLVLGQETEITNDDITIQRNWLIGSESNRTALILNFGTRFSSIENTVMTGKVIEGELAFFPSVSPQRAAFKMQRKVLDVPTILPSVFEDWQKVHAHQVQQVAHNPWLNDLVVIVKNIRLVKDQDQWIACDEQQHFMPLLKTYNLSYIMKWLVISGNQPLNMALVLRNQFVLPLGVFNQTTYTLL